MKSILFVILTFLGIYSMAECRSISGFNVVKKLDNGKYIISRQVGWTVGGCSSYSRRFGCMNRAQVPLYKDAILYLNGNFKSTGVFQGNVKVTLNPDEVLVGTDGFKHTVDSLKECK